MKNLTKPLLVAAFLLVANCCSAQSILSDSKGDPLFVVPSALFNIKLSSKVVGFDFPLYTDTSSQFFVYEGNRKGNRKLNTMSMSRSWYAGVTFIENSKSTLIFTKVTNLTPSLEIGFRRTLDSLQNPRLKSGLFYTFTVAAFAKYQHFTVYDKVSKTLLVDEQTRISPGVKAGLNLFRKDSYAFSFNGSWQKSVDADKLTSFQKLTPDFYVDPVVASNGKADGFLGPIDASHQFRFSAAWSYYGIGAFKFPSSFRFAEGLNKLQLAITPYYFMTTEKFDKISHNAGIGASILPSRIFGATKSKFSDALTFSYNLIKSADKDNAHFLFISGTFSFGNFKPTKEAKDAQKMSSIN